MLNAKLSVKRVYKVNYDFPFIKISFLPCEPYTRTVISPPLDQMEYNIIFLSSPRLNQIYLEDTWGLYTTHVAIAARRLEFRHKLWTWIQRPCIHCIFCSLTKGSKFPNSLLYYFLGFGTSY